MVEYFGGLPADQLGWCCPHLQDQASITLRGLYLFLLFLTILNVVVDGEESRQDPDAERVTHDVDGGADAVPQPIDSDDDAEEVAKGDVSNLGDQTRVHQAGARDGRSSDGRDCCRE